MLTAFRVPSSSLFALALFLVSIPPTATLPRTLAIGQPLSRLEPFLAEDCERTEVLHYTGETAAPFTRQTQVNCRGLEVFGARRDVEFMFNDGPLGHVWIHIAADERAAIGRLLERAFGPVVFATALDQVFASGTVALRADPPEVLVATPGLIADLTGYRKPPGRTGARRP